MIIGITGKKRHGKDTMANFLEGRFGAEVFHFADKLKKLTTDLYNLPSSFLKPDFDKNTFTNVPWKRFPKLMGHRHPETFVTFRELLQIMGTDILRSYDDDVLINGLLDSDTFRTTIDRSPMVVICDVRFDNEAKRIREMGGVIIQVIRPNFSEGEDNHSSEQGVSPEYLDWKMLNDQSISDLEDNTEDLIRTIRRQRRI
jgi:hypothetical protein